MVLTAKALQKGNISGISDVHVGGGRLWVVHTPAIQQHQLVEASVSLHYNPWMRDEGALSVALSGGETFVFDGFSIVVKPNSYDIVAGFVAESHLRLRLSLDRFQWPVNGTHD